MVLILCSKGWFQFLDIGPKGVKVEPFVVEPRGHVGEVRFCDISDDNGKEVPFCLKDEEEVETEGFRFVVSDQIESKEQEEIWVCLAIDFQEGFPIRVDFSCKLV